MGDVIDHSMFIPCDEVPRVIGHQGNTIKQIRMKSGARVNTDRGDVPGRPGQQEMRFSGTQLQVETAIALVNEALLQPPPSAGGAAPRPGQAAEAPEPGMVSKELIYPIESVTRIIGVQGANIKQMRLLTGAKINTERNSSVPGMPGHQTVRFDGTQGQVDHALALVEETLSKAGQPTAPTPQGGGSAMVPVSGGRGGDGGPREGGIQKSVAVPRDMITRIIGAQGMTIKHIRSASGCRINTDRDMNVPGHPGQQEIRFEGSEQQVDTAIAMVHEVLSNAQTDGGDNRSQHNPSSASYGRPSLGGSLSLLPSDGGRLEKTVLLPSEAVTKFIGPAGSHIKRIRAASGARINTDRSGGAQQPVIFQGSEPQVLAGIEMMLELIQSELPHLVHDIQLSNGLGGIIGGGASLGGMAYDSLGAYGSNNLLSAQLQLNQHSLLGGMGMPMGGGLGGGQMLTPLGALDQQLTPLQQQQLLLNSGALLQQMLGANAGAPAEADYSGYAFSGGVQDLSGGGGLGLAGGMKRSMDALAPSMVHDANGSYKLRRTEDGGRSH